jgi:hypothetical protein
MFVVAVMCLSFVSLILNILLYIMFNLYIIQTHVITLDFSYQNRS